MHNSYTHSAKMALDPTVEAVAVVSSKSRNSRFPMQRQASTAQTGLLGEERIRSYDFWLRHAFVESASLGLTALVC